MSMGINAGSPRYGERLLAVTKMQSLRRTPLLPSSEGARIMFSMVAIKEHAGHEVK